MGTLQSALLEFPGEPGPELVQRVYVQVPPLNLNIVEERNEIGIAVGLVDTVLPNILPAFKGLLLFIVKAQAKCCVDRLV